MITIQDNNYQGKVCSLHDTTDLLSIGNKPIRKLCYDNEHLLVFPLSIDDTDDRIGDSTIVDIYTEDENFVRIKSGNIMGVCRTQEPANEDIFSFRQSGTRLLSSLYAAESLFIQHL